MNRNTQDKRKQRRRSEVSRKLLLQYFLAIIGFVAGTAVLILTGWRFCHAFFWQPDDPIYLFLQYVQANILFFVGAFLLIGWLLITAYFISKPLRYLDEVMKATEKLASPTDDPIMLSAALSYPENELNLVREKALAHARAAQEAEQRKNDLVVYLAHDLKTPLTSVIGYLTLLRDEQQISAELQEKYLSIALDKSEHLEDLINEFFEITRFNLSHITLEYSNVNLTRMLEQLAFEFKPMLLAKNLTCSLKIVPDTMLRCDVDKMQRVFDNLLRNAVNYSFPGHTIEIAVTQSPAHIQIKFSNHGNTIPPEKLARIFEQFYRLDSARSTKNGGAGLGLAIAKEIVELHQGTITASSENEIITFTVTLPLA